MQKRQKWWFVFTWSKIIIFFKNDDPRGASESGGCKKCQKCEKCVFAQNLGGPTGASGPPFCQNGHFVTLYLWDAARKGHLIREKTRKRHLLVPFFKKVKKVTCRGSKNDPRGIQKWSFLRKVKKCKNTKTTSNPFSDYPHRCIIRACMCIHIILYILYIVYIVMMMRVNDQIMKSWFHDFMKMMKSSKWWFHENDDFIKYEIRHHHQPILDHPLCIHIYVYTYIHIYI